MGYTPGPWKDDVTEDGTLITAPELLEALEVMAEDFRVTVRMHIEFWNQAVANGFIPGGQPWTYDPTECSSYIAAQRVIAKARGAP